MISSLLLLFLYKILFFAAVKPAGRLLWSQAVMRLPAGHITNHNVTGALCSPIFWLVFSAMLAGLLLWTLLEISMILTCMEYINSRTEGGEKVRRGHRPPDWKVTFGRMTALVLRSVRRIRHAFQIRNLPIFVCTLLVVPFTNLLLTIGVIVRIVDPAYLVRIFRMHPFCFAGACGVMLMLFAWALEWMFVFHGFILRQRDFRTSVEESIRLLRGRRLHTLLQMVWRRFSVGAYVYAAAILGMGMMMAAVRILHWDNLVLATRDFRRCWELCFPGFVFFYSCAMTYAHYDRMTELYDRYSGEAASCMGTWRLRQRASAWLSHARSRGKTSAVRVLAGGGSAFVLVYVMTTAAVFTHASVLEMDEAMAYPAAITSHRGYSAVAPENTLPAFLYAIDCGKSDYAELDVRQTADGTVVAVHDASLKRCTGKNIRVSDITYEELCMLDASMDYTGPGASAFVGTAVPTLEDIVRLCKGRIKLNIEIKGDTPELEYEVVRIIREHELETECVISSSRYESLRKVKALAPELKCGYILSVGTGKYYDLPDVDFFSVEADFVNRKMVRELHLRGKEIHVWTVNTTKMLEKMIRIGVDNIITDEPEMVYDYMQQSEGCF